MPGEQLATPNEETATVDIIETNKVTVEAGVLNARRETCQNSRAKHLGAQNEFSTLHLHGITT